MFNGDLEKSVSTRLAVWRVDLRRKSIEPFTDEVVVESQVNLYINGHNYAALSVTPFEVRELAVGHLMTEGIINELNEIVELKISKERVDVQLSKEVPLIDIRVISAECGSRGRKIHPHVWMKSKKLSGVPVRFAPQTIMEAVRNLNLMAEIYRKTGGTHAAALIDEESRVLAVSEDISRHNAVDKVVGKLVLQGLDFNRTLLALTGRVSSDIVIKAVNVGIPLIASLSAPTDMGVKIAETTGLTLVGFARGRRFNVYAHPERINF